jgi:hypothetical protein
VRIKQRTPVTVTHLRCPARRIHDVGEQHRRENPIIGHFCLMPGEELGDLLERIAPRFHEVVKVAPLELNVFRVRNVVGDVLAHCGRDEWVVGVLDDEGGHADCRKDLVHVQFGHQRKHKGDGPRACRQAFLTGQRGPDLLVPRHVRIEQMLKFAGSPHGDYRAD